MNNRMTVEKFYALVQQGPSCWIWKGATQRGYGLVGFADITGKRASTGAHRIAWALAHDGELPPSGTHLHHVCRNKLCVNPDHLEPVSGRDHITIHFGDRCPRGHEPNWRINPRQRICRTCDRERAAEKRAGETVPCIECGKPKLSPRHAVAGRTTRFTGLCADCYRASDGPRLAGLTPKTAHA